MKKLASFFKAALHVREMGIVLVLLSVILIVGFINPIFYSLDNVMNVLRTTSYVVIIAIFATLVFIVGGLDMSVGALVGLGGLISAICVLYWSLPTFTAVLITLAVGALFGFLNGLAIVKARIPALIVTLGSQYIARGVVNVITKGAPVYPLPEHFNILGNGTLGEVPYSVILALILAVVVHIILKITVYGRNMYAIGGNEETAKLSGLSVSRIKVSVYVMSSMAAVVSGILMTSRIASAQVTTGQGMELTVIASVIIGGTSMFGGSGSVPGTLAGATLMTVLANGMVLIRVSAYWQSIVIGAVIIAAVAIDQYKRRKSGDII